MQAQHGISDSLLGLYNEMYPGGQQVQQSQQVGQVIPLSPSPQPAFEAFSKISRLFRNCSITEKLDGTNAQIFVPEDDGPLMFGSRNRWLSPDHDNFGFCRWGRENEAALRRLGPGRHFGEWWGPGIQRGYGLREKRFSLFNTARWSTAFLAELGVPAHVVPVLYDGAFSTIEVCQVLDDLREHGSYASPGFMRPEGIVVWHEAGRHLYKVTLDGDGHKTVEHKSAGHKHAA